MTKLRWIDWLVFGIVGFIVAFILYSIYGFVNNDGIELLSVYSPLVFPFLIGITLLICWVLTIINEIRIVGNEQSQDSKELMYDISIAVIYIFGVLIYSFVIGKVGFIIGSVLFLIIGMVFMNFDESNMIIRIRNAAAVSCITVPLLYYVFHEIFKVMLP
jgi:hypothetical protein